METRPHIVVVEDSASQRQMLVDYLVRQNLRASGVESGGMRRRRLHVRAARRLTTCCGDPVPASAVCYPQLRGRTGEICTEAFARADGAIVFNHSNP